MPFEDGSWIWSTSKKLVALLYLKIILRTCWWMLRVMGY